MAWSTTAANLTSKVTRFEPVHGKMKMVIIVRSDLKMGCGKIAAQCSHAAISCYEEITETNPGILEAWEAQGQPKIVLRVENYEEMLKLSNKAESLGLVNSIIHDAGHTQVPEGTATVLGIGPALASDIDSVSGGLKIAALKLRSETYKECCSINPKLFCTEDFEIKIYKSISAF